MSVETLSASQKQELASTSKSSVKQFSLEGRKMWVKVVGVYDADTCRVVLFLAGKPTQFSVRLSGIDTPEMRPARNKPNRDLEKKRAIQARNRLIQLVSDVEIGLDDTWRRNRIQRLLAESTKLVVLECGDFDKYGRLLGQLVINSTTQVGGNGGNGGNGEGDEDQGETRVNNILIEEGYAYKYDGGTKKPWVF